MRPRHATSAKKIVAVDLATNGPRPPEHLLPAAGSSRPPPAGPQPRSGRCARARPLPLPLPLRQCRRAARGPAAVCGVSPSLPSVSPSRSKFSPIPHLRSTQASNPSSWRRRRPGHPTSGREAGDGRAGSALSFEASAGARLGARAGGQRWLPPPQWRGCGS